MGFIHTVVGEVSVTGREKCTRINSREAFTCLTNFSLNRTCEISIIEPYELKSLLYNYANTNKYKKRIVTQCRLLLQNVLKEQRGANYQFNFTNGRGQGSLRKHIEIIYNVDFE